MSEQEISTRDGILAAARAEFLQKGYSGAGLREIAKKAGVTTGALYGYFKNKEEVFEALVGGHYQHILDLYRQILSSFSALPPEEQQTSMVDYTMAGIRRMTDYMYANRDAFKLILCSSEGTRYNDLIHEMSRLDVDATHDFAKSTGEIGMPVNPVNPTLEHILTSGMFAAFFELIIHDVPREQADEYVSQLIEFYHAGWAKIMGL